MMQDLHEMMKVIKKTTDGDSIFSYVGKIFDNEVVEAGKTIKSTADGQQKRGRKIGKVNLAKIPCEDEGSGKTVTLKSSLQKHKEKKKPTKCERCDEALKGKRELTIHMKKMHKQIRTFTCKTCYKSCGGEKALKNHEAKHDPTIGNGQYKCDFCEMFLTKKIGLQRHLEAVHNNEKERDRVLGNANTFLKDNSLVRSIDEVMKECVGNSEALELFKKVFAMEVGSG